MACKLSAGTGAFGTAPVAAGLFPVLNSRDCRYPVFHRPARPGRAPAVQEQASARPDHKVRPRAQWDGEPGRGLKRVSCGGCDRPAPLPCSTLASLLPPFLSGEAQITGLCPQPGWNWRWTGGAGLWLTLQQSRSSVGVTEWDIESLLLRLIPEWPQGTCSQSVGCTGDRRAGDVDRAAWAC